MSSLYYSTQGICNVVHNKLWKLDRKLKQNWNTHISVRFALGKWLREMLMKDYLVIKYCDNM